jgi:hypothetical protein
VIVPAMVDWSAANVPAMLPKADAVEVMDASGMSVA